MEMGKNLEDKVRRIKYKGQSTKYKVQGIKYEGQSTKYNAQCIMHNAQLNSRLLAPRSPIFHPRSPIHYPRFSISDSLCSGRGAGRFLVCRLGVMRGVSQWPVCDSAGVMSSSLAMVVFMSGSMASKGSPASSSTSLERVNMWLAKLHANTAATCNLSRS